MIKVTTNLMGIHGFVLLGWQEQCCPHHLRERVLVARMLLVGWKVSIQKTLILLSPVKFAFDGIVNANGQFRTRMSGNVETMMEALSTSINLKNHLYVI